MSTAKRLDSIDAFRGFDMLFIMGFGSVITGLGWCLTEMLGGDADAFWKTSAFVLQFRHVEWTGLRFEDLIFPTFIFIAGISFPFSYARQVERGDSPGCIHLRLLRRMVVLVLLGIAYNGFFRLEFPARYGSVLGKIGVAGFLASFAYIHLGLKARVVACAGILALYLAVGGLFVAPDAPAGTLPYTPEGCFAGWVSRLLSVGRLQDGCFDNCGLVPTLGAVPTAMFGMFAGDLLRSSRLTGGRKTLLMFGGALMLFLAGLALEPVCPVIKKLWTPTFACISGACSLGAFAVFYWIVDVRGFRAWTYPLRVVGLNSITIYLLQKFIDVSSIARNFVGVKSEATNVGLCGLISSLALAYLISSVAYVTICWLVLCFLHRQKVYFKV